MPDFVLRAFVAGTGVAIVMGAAGVFVVWRRMAYFGDTLAHSALLGVTFGLITGIDINIGIVAVCLGVAFAMVLLRHQRHLAEDTLLGILAHSSLGLGLVAVSFLATLRVDLMAYLFGDILATSATDIIWIYGGGAAALGILAWLWQDLVAITVHEDLARVEGVDVPRTQTAFMLLFALVIAMAMKVVGIMMVTALLIIPAATARRFARTPERMALLAALLGILGVTAGLQASLIWDTPSGPSIVVASAAIYAISVVLPAKLTA